jgi:hypothetical protein
MDDQAALGACFTTSVYALFVRFLCVLYATGYEELPGGFTVERSGRRGDRRRAVDVSGL